MIHIALKENQVKIVKTIKQRKRKKDKHCCTELKQGDFKPCFNFLPPKIE